MKKIALNEIMLSTRLYEREYGKMPKGRGCWAFSIGNTEAYNDVTKAFFTPGSTTYKEAQRIAREEARRQNADIIYVLP